ncbi:NAD(P)/FAD-dependent oxidoreductase [Halobacteriales archaeon QS_1_68_20]|nr:MAG: NAD(P)/FAD-dependent oxidoreductase [Halobacteriales archaeon QS_1_68_20]
MVHVLVIGAYGSAGSAVASELADRPDVELTLVDDGDPGGGLCILRGCMPSKEVLSAGAHRYQARKDERLVGDLPEIDLERTVERKDDNVLGWAGHRRASIHDLAEREDVEFLSGTAEFVDDRVVAVGDRTVDPDYVVIATGSSPYVPDLPGIEDVDYVTSEDVLDATSFPDSGIVMGFGFVGMELAPYIAEAGGTDLTVIEHDDAPIDQGDPSFGEELLDIYERDFPIDVLRNTHEQRIEPTADGGVRLHVERGTGGGDVVEETAEADQLFLFTGRVPTLDRLGLENTALEPGEGWVDDTLQSRDDPRVFVAGDANGRAPVLHVGKEEGFTTADNVLRHHRGEELREYDPIVQRVVFSGLGVYPFARVGHTEQSAREAGLDYVAVTRRAEDDGVFKSKDVPDGLAKLVVDAADGTVLGYQGLHFHADVMAKTMHVLVELGVDVREVPDRAYHPTTPEILDGLFRAASERIGR